MSRAGAVAQHLGRWARALSSSPCASAVPATVTQTDSSLFGFMGRKQAMPPMNVPLEGVETVHPAEVSASPPPTETATLSNGVRIGAQDIMNPMSSIALVVEAGSVYENAHTEGASQLLQGMAFKGSQTRTHFATIRQAENYGITMQCMASREAIIYYASAPRDSISAAAELVCDAAMRPAITQHKLDEVKAATGKRNGDMVNDPSFMASEGVVAAAYSGALARPVLWTGAPITPETLQDFHSHTFTPSNTTMAISGAPVSTAESLANDFLGGIPSSPTPPKAPSTYVGGGSSEHYTANATAVVAFETDGWAAMDNSVLSTVVTYLLGGGSDFSSGGPGKGMHSRLYQSVLTAKPWVSSCTAYSNIFENTGLLGILMSTPDPSKAPELVDTLCQELEALSKGASSEEVERAKAMCEAAVHGALEAPHIVAEDIGRQMITYKRRVPLDEFQQKVQAIDTSAVQKFCSRLLSGKPSGVLIGDQTIMPKFDAVERRFNK